MKRPPRNPGTGPHRSGPSASEAKDGLTVLETVSDRDLVMKNKAFPFPLAFLGGDFFEVMEDASPKMIDFVEPVLQRWEDAFSHLMPRAKHRHFSLLGFLKESLTKSAIRKSFECLGQELP